MSNIESVLNENRRFLPTQAFQASARLNNEVTYQRMHRASLEDPEGFWGRVAGELPWFERWTKELDWSEAAGRMARPLLVDGRNFLEAEKLIDAGFEYEGIGRSIGAASPAAAD